MRRQTRRDQWQALYGIRWRLLTALAVWATAIALVASLQTNDFARGLFVGAMATSFGFVIYSYLAALGTVQRGMGADAEQWTTSALRKLGREWLVIDDVSISGSNVDHVVVGPSAVYAVETKYMSRVDDRRIAAAARQAENGARRIRLLLPSQNAEREVVPLVVVWGPGRHGLSSPVESRDHVRLVAGADEDEWLPLIRQSATSHEPDLGAYQAIAAFVTRRDKHDARRSRARPWPLRATR